MSSRAEHAECRPAPEQEPQKPRSPLLAKLKPGPGKSPEQVRKSQRVRIHRAMIELVAEVGYPGVTVRGLLRTSGVSSRTLYAHFANVDECFVSTYRSITSCALRDLSQAAAGSPDPRHQVRAGLQALFEQIASDPRPGRLALVDVFDAGPALEKEMALTSRRIGRCLPFDSGRRRANPYVSLLELGVVAGIERVIRGRILEGREAELPAMAAELSEWIASFQDLDLNQLWSLGRSITAETVQSRFPLKLDESISAMFKAVEGDRGRLLSAAAKLGLARGYWRLSPSTVRGEAGVSRRRFNQLFANPDECFLEATETLLVAAVGDILQAGAGAPSWQGRTSDSILAFCAELAQRPDLARLCFVDFLAPGGAGLLSREHLTSSTAEVLRSWRPANQPSPALTDEAAVAASWQIIQAEIAVGRAGQLAQVSPLLACLLIPPEADSHKYSSILDYISVP